MVRSELDRSSDSACVLYLPYPMPAVLDAPVTRLILNIALVVENATVYIPVLVDMAIVGSLF